MRIRNSSSLSWRSSLQKVWMGDGERWVFLQALFLLLAVRGGGRGDVAVGMAHAQTSRKSVVVYCTVG